MTAELPGIGGAIKQNNEDFQVIEIPRYTPCGSGTHIYFGIEKTGVTTLGAIKRLARALDRSSRDFGYAGMKDAHAVTRQSLSLEHIDPHEIERLTFDDMRVLWVSRHTNKLKLGHLTGNRFCIRIRDVNESAEPRAKQIIDELARRGVPNYFGPQRFGNRGDNALVGLAALLGDYVEAIRRVLVHIGPMPGTELEHLRGDLAAGRYAEVADALPGRFRQLRRICRILARDGNTQKAWHAVDRTHRRLYFSAAQSHLFNLTLARRIDTIDRLATGDLAYKHDNGACFEVRHPTDEQPRADRLEISPSGPLFGRKMTEPSDSASDIEQAVLADCGIDPGLFTMRHRFPLEGARRPLRVPLGQPRVTTGDDATGSFLELQFDLPPGSYATSVTREVCKSAT